MSAVLRQSLTIRVITSSTGITAMHFLSSVSPRHHPTMAKQDRGCRQPPFGISKLSEEYRSWDRRAARVRDTGRPW